MDFKQNETYKLKIKDSFILLLVSFIFEISNS